MQKQLQLCVVKLIGQKQLQLCVTKLTGQKQLQLWETYLMLLTQNLNTVHVVEFNNVLLYADIVLHNSLVC